MFISWGNDHSISRMMPFEFVQLSGLMEAKTVAHA